MPLQKPTLALVLDMSLIYKAYSVEVPVFLGEFVVNHIIGIGGIFFKAQDPKQLGAWYKSHLGIAVDEDTGSAMLKWRELEHPENERLTVWGAFPSHTTYFDPSSASFMINYIVDDLDQTLADLRVAGVHVDDRVDESDYGRFGWATDPEGNRFELWEPPHAK